MRVAVLGCGSIGRRHLRNLRTLGLTELIAFDPDPASRETASREASADCCVTLEQVWARAPDAVLVAAPSKSHLPLALSAAQRGCHLFVEKPLSHSRDGIDRLLDTVERMGLVTMVGCNMRFHPGPGTVKRLLDDRAIGAVVAARIHTGSYLPDWRPGSDYRSSYSADRKGGGALLDQIHEVDLSLWYFGPGRLVAADVQPARALDLDVDGLAELLIRHQSGVLSSVHLNFIQRDYRRYCQIIGERGTIYWDFEKPLVEVKTATRESQRVELPADWPINQMYLDELREFVECVRDAKQTSCTFRDGAAALALVLAARQQAPAAQGVQAEEL